MSQNGNDMMFSVNNKLGTAEIIDQIAVTDFLVKKYKFIDPKRVAIWGW
jgi:dipeptidyl-peptidase 4